MTIIKRLLSSSITKTNKRVGSSTNTTATAAASSSSSSGSSNSSNSSSSNTTKYTRFPRILLSQSIVENTTYLSPVQNHQKQDQKIKRNSLVGMGSSLSQRSNIDDNYNSLYSSSSSSTPSSKNINVASHGSAQLAYNMFFASHRPLLSMSRSKNIKSAVNLDTDNLFNKLHESLKKEAIVTTQNGGNGNNNIPEDGSYSTQFVSKLKGIEEQGGIDTIGLQSSYRYASGIPKELMNYLNKNVISTIGVVSCMFMECDKNWIKVGESHFPTFNRNNSFKPYSLEREIGYFNNSLFTKK